LLVGFLFIMMGCSRTPKEEKDKASYAIGLQFGKSLKSQKLDLNTGFLKRGIEDGYEGKKSELSMQETSMAIAKLGEERQKAAKAKAEKNRAAGDAFLAQNKTVVGVKTTDSGLQYKVLREGTGPSPKITDRVVVNYRGTLIDGTEFDSNAKRGTPAEFPVKGVIPGWSEGLRLMKKGGKMAFYIPPSLAYGDRDRATIPGGSTLIFEVELLNIK
jgi:FKBP-type peptidyl-prolyl cis-trans isomerase